MEKLKQNQLEEINGGNPAVSFILSYILSKGIDWAWAHRAEIWQNFRKGPGENDPMRQTDFYKIFGK